MASKRDIPVARTMLRARRTGWFERFEGFAQRFGQAEFEHIRRDAGSIGRTGRPIHRMRHRSNSPRLY